MDPQAPEFTISSISIVAAASVAALLAWSLTYKAKSRLPLPPGPKPRPLIGNLLDIPREKNWLAYHKLSEEYGKDSRLRFSSSSRFVPNADMCIRIGDVVHLEALGQHFIILNSLETVNDLLERRSTIYSSRANPTMLNDL